MANQLVGFQHTDSYSGGETDGGYWKYGDSSGLDGVPIEVIADDMSAIS